MANLQGEILSSDSKTSATAAPEAMLVLMTARRAFPETQATVFRHYQLNKFDRPRNLDHELCVASSATSQVRYLFHGRKAVGDH